MDSSRLGRRTVAVVAAWIVVVAAGLTMRARYPGSGPVAKVAGAEVDLGTITFGAPVSHTFELANVGDQALAVTQIETTCACTASTLTRLIAPSTVGQVTLAAETLGFRTGVPERVAATVITNDPNRRSVELTVRFVLEPEFEVSMPMFRFVDSVPGATLVSRIRITPGSSSRVVSVRSTTSAVSAQLRRQANSEGREEVFEVEATLVDGTRIAEGGVVVVETSSPYLSQIRLPVVGR